jgi:hypothetical protein
MASLGSCKTFDSNMHIANLMMGASSGNDTKFIFINVYTAKFIIQVLGSNCTNINKLYNQCSSGFCRQKHLREQALQVLTFSYCFEQQNFVGYTKLFIKRPKKMGLYNYLPGNDNYKYIT